MCLGEDSSLRTVNRVCCVLSSSPNQSESMWNSIPVDSVGNCENVSGRNGTKDGVFGTVSRVRSDTSNGVILRKRERSREVRSYADIL